MLTLLLKVENGLRHQEYKITEIIFEDDFNICSLEALVRLQPKFTKDSNLSLPSDLVAPATNAITERNSSVLQWRDWKRWWDLLYQNHLVVLHEYEKKIKKKIDKKWMERWVVIKKGDVTHSNIFYVHFSFNSILPSIIFDGVLISHWTMMNTSPTDCFHLDYQYRKD